MIYLDKPWVFNIDGLDPNLTNKSLQRNFSWINLSSEKALAVRTADTESGVKSSYKHS